MSKKSMVNAACAVAFLLLPSTSAPAAIVTLEPSVIQARTFATTQGGWTSSVDYGGVCAIPGVTCPLGTASFQATDGTGGAGDGHLRAQVATLVGLASTTTVSWTSPSFVAPATIDQASLTLSARPLISSLLSVGATTQVDVELVDLTTPADSQLLGSLPLTSASSAYGQLQLAVSPGALTAGASYQLQLRTRVATPVAGSVSGSVDYDDVALQFVDMQPPTGLSATVPSSGTLRVEGQVDPQGQATDVFVDYGPTSAYGSSTSPAAVGGSGAQPFTIPLAGLTGGATYHYRVRATSADGTGTTSDATFVVPTPPADPPPIVPVTPSGQDDPQIPASTANEPRASTLPKTGPNGAPISDPGHFGLLLERCYGAADLVLTDARVSAGRAQLSGLTRFTAGTAIAILDEHGRTVARTKADAHGSFHATAPLPANARQPHTLYTAVAGSQRSSRLRLLRDNTLRSVHVHAGMVTIRGHVSVAHLGAHVRFVVLGGHGSAACRHGGTRLRLVGHARFDRRSGAYALRVHAPGGRGLLAISTRAAGRAISHSAYVLR